MDSEVLKDYGEKNEEKPLLIVRYSKKKLVGYFIFLALALFLFDSAALFYTQQLDESYYKYLFLKIGFWFAVFMIIYMYIDELNAEKFEIYEDKIEKKVRIFKKNSYFRR
ncbi:hypothetical protein [Persephonella sp.]